MAINIDVYQQISKYLHENNVTLVAVSKTKPIDDIMALYELGQRDFGENYVQELVDKQAVLPKDIRWHFIGHLQSNKVKYIASFVHLIHGIDSYKLLQEVNKQAAKHERMIDCLLQLHIAKEETKFGFDAEEAEVVLHKEKLPNVAIKGLMGMASFTDNTHIVSSEFNQLGNLYKKLATQNHFTILSMGMSGDYQLAIEQGSNMVRIGSLLFGARGQKQ